jgi:hypothetical protein
MIDFKRLIWYKMQSRARARKPVGASLMPFRLSRSLFAVAALCFAGAAAHADTLLIDRVQRERGADLPARGQSMSQVEKRFGAPTTRLNPAGGDSRWHPTINRWVYSNFTVYFERDRVIDAVLNRATPDELGPKRAAYSR